MVNKYTKKPVEIEAVKFEYTPECIDLLRDWLSSEFKGYGKDRTPDSKGWIEIGTLEDSDDGQVKHIATEGDYIIKGVQGEFYACKPNIFEQTYTTSNAIREQLITDIIDKEFSRWVDADESENLWEPNDVKKFSQTIISQVVQNILHELGELGEECENFDDWDRGFNCGWDSARSLIKENYTEAEIDYIG